MSFTNGMAMFSPDTWSLSVSLGTTGTRQPPSPTPTAARQEGASPPSLLFSLLSLFSYPLPSFSLYLSISLPFHLCFLTLHLSASLLYPYLCLHLPSFSIYLPPLSQSDFSPSLSLPLIKFPRKSNQQRRQRRQQSRMKNGWRLLQAASPG